MNADPISLAGLLCAIGLMVAPGLLAATPLGAGLSPGLRLVVGVVLSPAVLALETALAAAAGLPFPAFAAWVAPLNLLGFLLLRRSPDTAGASPLAPAVLLSLAVVAPAMLLLGATPLLREYGWHNMMQVAALEPIHALPALPEEWDLAGFRLNYPWLGLVPFALFGALADLPATRVFPWLNLLHFVCLFVLLDAAARTLRPGAGAAGTWAAALATGILLLTPSLPDIVLTLAGVAGPVGETRIRSVAAKSFLIDTMVFGLSAFALLILGVTRGTAGAGGRAVPLILAAALACGLTYPLLFPACAVVIGTLVLGLLAARFRPRLGLPAWQASALLGLVLGFAAVSAIMAAYLLTVGADATGRVLHLARPWEIRLRSMRLVLALGPLLLAALLLLWLRWRRGTVGGILVPVGAFLALAACYPLLGLPKGVEYKFLFAAVLTIVPVLAAALADAAAGRRLGVPLLGAAFLLLAAGQLWALPQRQEPPPLLGRAVPLDESTRLPHPREGWAESWMRAVREATPADTVLLTGDTDQPVPVFAGRPVYVAADWTGAIRPDGGRIGRVGYGMTRDEILVEVKGYPAAEVARRERMLRASLAPDTSPALLRDAAEALAALGRPVALHATGPSALVEALRARGLGRAVHRRGEEVVWLATSAELAALVADLPAPR